MLPDVTHVKVQSNINKKIHNSDVHNVLYQVQHILFQQCH